MATSSERSPPPFPDSEDQEPEPEEVGDHDSDDGEDIFLGSDDLLETKMASIPVGDAPAKTQSDPFCDLFSEPLMESAGAPKAQMDFTEKPASEMTIGSTQDVIEVKRDIAKAPEVVTDAATGLSERDIISKPRLDVERKPGKESTAPMVDVLMEPASKTSTAPMVDVLMEPASKTSTAPMVDVLMEPASKSSTAPMVDVLMEPASKSSTAPMVDVLMEPASKSSTAPMVDVFMEPAGKSSTAPMVDVLMEPASKSSTALKGDSISKPSSTSVVDLLCEPSSDNVKESKPDILDPLADVIQTAPGRNAKAPFAAVTEEPTRDLFDDTPSNLFAKSQPSKPAKHLQTSIFDDPDEDLFGEHLGDALKKPQNDASKGEAAPVAKARHVRGPLTDNHKEEGTDIFTEGSVTSHPSAVNRVVPANSKTNGVQSDEEEPDIFSEATVELSLDSPRNDRKRKEVANPSAPPAAVAANVTKPQPLTLEELEEEESEDKFELNISITNPEKVGDGMNAYMAYKVSTQTTLPMFRMKSFTVRRRFSDFLGLYEKLSDKHAQSGYIVPPPPEKSIMGMTKVKVGKEDNSSAEFVEKRRAALERYLQRVVCHPSLLQDPDVREFLERDDIPRAHSTQALSGAGFLKMINRATDAVSKMTIKMNESDVWFEDKLCEVEAEDQQLRKLHIMVESLVGHRKELSVNTAGFAKSVAMLGSSEDNTALSRALSQLAEVEDKMEQLHQDQATNDSFCFAELLADYIRLLGSVRASFDQRMKSWQRWQDAQNILQKKRETEAKLLWANKPDKLQQAKDEINEWEAKVTQYEKDFDRVSSTVRKEVLRFEKEKARDFKKQIIKYLESLLQSQQQLIKYWEAFLPEAKAIA
ncbi:hypothetical protein DPEC_G00221470 [Dallia pectoralis]|uniref:Uncharacterized protein n=1 Tax=Dallia pectoralis TaxID=75939 RepID=A0ACC2G432_DALPE|nr:hypothetical protein DPEC_G00221470 [Dallia pectoralis]